MRRGSAERILSLPAAVVARVHGLFPGVTADLLGVVNRVLPAGDGGSTDRVRGRQAQTATRSGLLGALTTLGRSAARRFNERS